MCKKVLLRNFYNSIYIIPSVGVLGGSFFFLISSSDGLLSMSDSHKNLSLNRNAAAEVERDLDAHRRQDGRSAMMAQNSHVSKLKMRF